MDQRSMAVLHHLVQAESYLSVPTLAKIFNVSRRTIYNDLSKIDDWLQANRLPQIKQVRGSGLYLDDDTKKQIPPYLFNCEQNYYEFSPAERKAWIFLHLVGEDKIYFLEDLRQLFRVSRNTVLDDIRKLKKELAVHHLKINSDIHEGYQVAGDENDIRHALVNDLSVVTPENGWYEVITTLLSDKASTLAMCDLHEPYSIFNSHRVHLLRNLLLEYEKHHQIEIIDSVLDELVIWFHFFIKRIEKKQFVDVDEVEKEVIQTTEEYQGAKKICQQLADTLNMAIPTDEVHYIAKYLLSAKVNYKLNLKPENEAMKMLSDVVVKMVADFQHYAAIEFPNEEKMIQNLFLHLKAAYYRIKYGIQIKNILYRSVKENYPEVFYLTQKVIHHFSDVIHQPVSENEIAYIAMHFGGWLKQEGVTLSSPRKRLLIVCPNGLGTSRLLESQLEELLSDVDIVGVASLRDYAKMDLTADLIVSTTPLPDRGVPVFVVSAVLNNQEKEALLRNINSLSIQPSQEQIYSVDTVVDLVKRYASIQEEEGLKRDLRRYFQSPLQMDKLTKPNLAELLTRERIIFLKKVESWEEAIQKAAQPLLEQGFIQESYLKKMIQYVKEKGPYMVMTNQYALPHAAPDDGVNQTGMSMLCLKEPVDLMGKSVRILIVLASLDNMEHLKAMGQLTKLLSNQRRTLLQVSEKEKMVELIQDFSVE